MLNVDGWTDGWTDERTDERMNGRKLARLCLPAKAGATKTGPSCSKLTRWLVKSFIKISNVNI